MIDKIKNKFSKKGELTTQQIVTLIVLIISFAVILFLLFRLDLGEETDKEICHNSVVMQGKTSILGGSLDCNTNYVCISGGDKCKDITPSVTKKIDLTKSDKDKENQIYKAIAEEMADCWWMFGEGRVDYEGNDWKGYHCAICSIIKFDEKIQGLPLTYEGLYEYLNNKKDETQTYSKYLYGNNVNFEDIKLKFSGPISTDEKYSVITGLNPDWPSADSFIYPLFVKSSDVGDKTKTSCTVFDVTKA